MPQIRQVVSDAIKMLGSLVENVAMPAIEGIISGFGGFDGLVEHFKPIVDAIQNTLLPALEDLWTAITGGSE